MIKLFFNLIINNLNIFKFKLIVYFILIIYLTFFAIFIYFALITYISVLEQYNEIYSNIYSEEWFQFLQKFPIVKNHSQIIPYQNLQNISHFSEIIKPTNDDVKTFHIILENRPDLASRFSATIQNEINEIMLENDQFFTEITLDLLKKISKKSIPIFALLLVLAGLGYIDSSTTISQLT